MTDDSLILPLEVPLQLQRGRRYWLQLAAEQQRETQLDRIAVAAQRACPGQVASLDGGGGLVANLRIWENLILPAWYHRGTDLPALETVLLQHFAAIGIEDDEAANLCQGLPSALTRERKQELALVRAALLEPACLLVEGDWLRFLSYGRGQACRELFQRLAQQAVTIVVAAFAAPDADDVRLALGEAGQLHLVDEHETA